jgi:NADPH:quinone reductase-like Zn-dependent oxidoreductase
MAQQLADQMKAIAIERFGGLDELKEYDLPKPEPAADEVLIRVRAAGVGIWDSKQRRGTFLAEMAEFPLILGEECAGDIERVGSSVTELHENDAVYTYFVAKHGSYAQYVAVKAGYVARKPAGLSYLEAAAVPVVGITAHQSIVDEINLQPDEWLFVAGGAGGVGSFAVQVALGLGARVIASALTEDFAYLESLGVVRANLIDYTQTDVVAAVRSLTNGIGVDAALDAAAGESWKQTVQALKDGGRMAQLTGQPVTTDLNVTVLNVLSKPSADRLDKLREMFDAGQLKVHVEKSFPLAQAGEAQQTVEQHHRPGEIVLSIN